MAWLGMSIPTLPGTARRPHRNPPGTRNIQREKEREQEKLPGPISPAIVPDEKPLISPSPKPLIPKTPNTKPKIKGN